MIIKCTAKLGKDLPTGCLLPSRGFGIDHVYPLIISKLYVVYGMTLNKGYVRYYLYDEYYNYYPRWNPSPFFEVVNSELSQYWVCALDTEQNDTRFVITYPEWANDPYYQDRLTDGEEKDVEIFKKYKYLMDLEFPNPSIKEVATELDYPWFFCPICIDAWESTSIDGMVICPKCRNFLHNLRYQKKPSSFLTGITL